MCFEVNKVVTKWGTLMWDPLYHVTDMMSAGMSTYAFSPFAFQDMSKSSIILNANAIQNANTVNTNPNLTLESSQSQYLTLLL